MSSSNNSLFGRLRADAAKIEPKSLNLCCIILILLMAVMSIINVASGEHLMACITASLSLWFLINAVVFRITKRKTWLTMGILLAGYILLMYFLIDGGIDGFSIVWLLLIPPGTSYFFSLYYGGSFSIILGVSVIAYMWTPLNTLGYQYSDTYLLRFPIVYFFDLILSIVILYRVMCYKQKQEELLESVTSADRSKSDFLANMSHEIRTPMNAIIGMCELILRDQDINESVRENCFNIQSSGRSLLSIINDILDFSKIESGKLEIIESEFNIASILNDVINMTVTRKGDKKIEIMVHADPDIPRGLIGDEIRIRQIMINLMTNAVKFTNSGAVTLRVSQTKQEYGINLKVTVADSGIGITEENLEKLFSSFQQVDTRKNRAIEGTGLGLAISKRLITKMGGFINVSSEYGVGSTFSFVVPLKVKDERPFIKVDNPEKLMALGFFNLKRFDVPAVEEMYKNLMDEISRQLNIGFVYTESFDEMKRMLEGGKITHLFIGKEQFLEHKDFFISNSGLASITLVQDIVDAVRVPEGIRCIYKPFYTVSAALAINNESVATLNERRGSVITFSAPRARVLVVDDNQVNLKVVSGLMQPYHMQILTVDSGKAAISMLRSKDIDLVLMDHMMPEMDGVETTSVIRQMEGDYYKKLPIIALTANAVNGVREMFIESGFNDFVAKPIELGSLDRALKTHLPEEYIMNPVSDDYGPTDRRESKYNYEEPYGLINVAKGLNYAGGNRDVYYEILEVFVRKGDDKRKEIEALAAQTNWHNYVIEVHALKSTSLTIGAVELSEKAKKLELAGKAGDFDIIIKDNDELMQSYNDVIAEGRKFLEKEGIIVEAEIEEAAPEDMKPVSLEILREYCIKIRECCDGFDSDGIVEIAEQAILFSYEGKSLKPYFDKIVTRASDFEYDEALEELDRMCAELNM